MINRGASPLGLPYTLTRSPLRRLAPFAWLASLRSLALQSRMALRVHRSGQLRIGIPDGRGVGRSRARVEILEDPIVALARLRLHDAAVRIVQIAEDDRVGRARGGAGGHDLAVPDRAVLPLRVDARLVDALHAVGALLHDAAA